MRGKIISIFLLAFIFIISCGFSLQAYKITINNPNSETLTDFQVKITLDSSLTDFWDKVNHDGTNFRFYLDTDLTNKLPYWVEKWDYNNKKAIVWIKVPSLKPGDNYVYLAITSDTKSESDGNNVFEFFDDFNGNSLDSSKWKKYLKNGQIFVDNSILKIRANNDPRWETVISKLNVSLPVIIETKEKEYNGDWSYIWTYYGEFPYDFNNNNKVCDGGVCFGDNPFNSGVNNFMSFGFQQGYGTDRYANPHHYGDSYNVPINQWYIKKAKLKNDWGELCVDTNFDGNMEHCYSHSLSLPSVGKLGFVYEFNGEYWIDWIFVRKYAPKEPKVVNIEKVDIQLIDVVFLLNKTTDYYYNFKTIPINITNSFLTDVNFSMKFYIDNTSVENKTITIPKAVERVVVNHTYQSYNITINNPNNETLTDFQVKIQINSTNFPSFWDKVNHDGTNFRFYLDTDLTNKLPYWIEKWDYNNKQAIVWIKVHSLKPGDNYVYLAITNDTKSESDGDKVFESIDDFNGNSLDTNKWVANNNKYAVENGYLRIWGDWNNNNYYLRTKNDLIFPNVVEGKVKFLGISTGVDFTVSFGKGASWEDETEGTCVVFDTKGHDSAIRFHDGSHYLNDVEVADTNWHKFMVYFVNKNWKMWLDNGKEATYIKDLPPTQHKLGVGRNSDSYSIYLDYVFVRKYADKEPKVVKVGGLENITYSKKELVLTSIVLNFTINTKYLTQGEHTLKLYYVYFDPNKNKTIDKTIEQTIFAVRYNVSIKNSAVKIWRLTINNPNSETLTDFQVKITLDSSLTDFWDKVNHDGTNFRFYLDTDLTNKLPYWIEKWDYNNKQADVWIKVPSLKPGDNYVYLAITDDTTSESNPNKVFLYFDDFDDGVWNDKYKLTLIEDYSYSIQEENSYLYLHAYSGRALSKETKYYLLLKNFLNFAEPTTIDFKIDYYLEGDSGNGGYIIISAVGVSNNALSSYSQHAPYSGINKKNGVDVSLKNIPANTNYKLKYYISGGYESSTTSNLKIYYVKIRKYAPNEPTIKDIEEIKSVQMYELSQMTTSPMVFAYKNLSNVSFYYNDSYFNIYLIKKEEGNLTEMSFSINSFVGLNKSKIVRIPINMSLYFGDGDVENLSFVISFYVNKITNSLENTYLYETETNPVVFNFSNNITTDMIKNINLKIIADNITYDYSTNNCKVVNNKIICGINLPIINKTYNQTDFSMHKYPTNITLTIKSIFNEDYKINKQLYLYPIRLTETGAKGFGIFNISTYDEDTKKLLNHTEIYNCDFVITHNGLVRHQKLLNTPIISKTYYLPTKQLTLNVSCISGDVDNIPTEIPSYKYYYREFDATNLFDFDFYLLSADEYNNMMKTITVTDTNGNKLAKTYLVFYRIYLDGTTQRVFATYSDNLGQIKTSVRCSNFLKNYRIDLVKDGKAYTTYKAFSCNSPTDTLVFDLISGNATTGEGISVGDYFRTYSATFCPLIYLNVSYVRTHPGWTINYTLYNYVNRSATIRIYLIDQMGHNHTIYESKSITNSTGSIYILATVPGKVYLEVTLDNGCKYKQYVFTNIIKTDKSLLIVFALSLILMTIIMISKENPMMMLIGIVIVLVLSNYMHWVDISMTITYIVVIIILYLLFKNK